jgi:alpha-2-macroglobulin
VTVRRLVLAAILTLAAFVPLVAQQPSLTVLRAGPTGELASLDQANEIRIVFSEPMVTLGRIPSPLEIPYVRIEPAIAGTFRWSGTTILIFTPDPRRTLPFATQYRVTVDPAARAVSGRQLSKSFAFTFTTPTVRLLAVDHYRRDGRFDAPVVVLIRTNQPVDAASVLPHVTVRAEPHDWPRPTLPPSVGLKSSDPATLERFKTKLAAADAAARSNAAVPMQRAREWDTKQWPASPDLVVLQTAAVPPPETWLRVALDRAVPSPQGRATPGIEQSRVVELGRTFFVEGFQCTRGCNPSRYNGLRLSTTTGLAEMRGATTVAHLTTSVAPPVPPRATPSPREEWNPTGAEFSLEDLRYAQPPATTYAVRVAASLQSEDGQTLGYTWADAVENWHAPAFTSFGEGHGVWEASGGSVLPFFARNYQDIRQWLAPIAPRDLMPRIRQLAEKGFSLTPPGPGTSRRLAVDPDKIQSHGLELKPVLNPAGRGLVWAGVQDGTPIPRAGQYPHAGGEVDEESGRDRAMSRKATVVQVTNLGITVKDSPANTLVFVTRLDTGEPVADARVSIVRTDNSIFWTGQTNGAGIALAPDTRLRNPQRPWELAFLVTAEKDGDIAYVASDWNEGLSSWEFGLRTDLDEARPLLRGSVFTDRGVYRLGEEIHAKAILRGDTTSGIQLIPPGTTVYVSTRDSQAREVDRRTLTLSEWSSAEWTLTLPTSGPLGNYVIQARLEPPRERKPQEEFDYRPERVVSGTFLVAAYRRPDFRVDATLTSATPITGAPLAGTVSARYLFGAAMSGRPARWKVTRDRVYDPPPAIVERFPAEQWTFIGFDFDETQSRTEEVASAEGTLDKAGELAVPVQTPRDGGGPFRYTLEAEVEDVSRQRIANRTSLTVHPAPWYVGIKSPSYFVDQQKGFQGSFVAVTPGGDPAPGVPLKVTLQQVQWNSVRRAEGGGFYTWDTERRVIDAGSWDVTTTVEGTPLSIPLPSGGYFVLTARAEDGEGRSTTSTVAFYSLGTGYTAWTRYDHYRIDLEPEQKTYKPGDTARIIVKSPWEQATALLTTEREGIRTHRRFQITSTQQTLSVPVTENDIPNVYVSVVLVKGRTKTEDSDDGSDPGKPSFRLGYVELRVEDTSKRLTTTVTANQAEYRPATNARVNVELRDAKGAPAVGEVTLWAVDYGILSLTNFETPDVLGSVYVQKALQVQTEDNRLRIVSRRAITPKGTDDGGGGGGESGAGTLRRDFRALAFWVGSTVTDATGKASVDLKLPESLTTYRIMAVSGDKASRFGWGQSEIRINKPVTLQPAFPRFLALGDRAFFGSVVTNQLPRAGDAVITMRSLDPGVLRIEGDERQRVKVAAGGSAEVRFSATARSVGRARLQMTVRLDSETDGYEDSIPVEVLAAPETVAAHGETDASTEERLTMPAGVVPGFGGLSVELASTAMVGLAEGARYLVEYPYGCAEQKGSRALALLLASVLGDTFTLPGIEPADLKLRTQSVMNELPTFQCGDGGFAYWPGGCPHSSEYLTSYLLHVIRSAAANEYDVDATMQSRAYDYLERALAQPPPRDEGWWPAYLAWQAFAVKVLVDGGRNQDSTITRVLQHVDRMPVFALAHLLDAMAVKGETGPRRADLLRRIENAILPEGGSAHVEELNDPYLLWFWNSNVRSTAIVLGVLVRHGSADLSRIRPIVRWLMQVREQGRWGNTQENAWALEALVDYYRTYETATPDFTATASLGSQSLAKEAFKGRSTDAASRDLPMRELARSVPAGAERRLRFEKQGSGTLFYATRLRYAVDQLFHEGLDRGFGVERSYAPFVEGGDSPPATTFAAGSLVRVTLRVRLTKERRFVAMSDPLPAGFEPVESWFATTASDLARAQESQGRSDGESSWIDRWERGGFDHVERHDDRVLVFATRLSEGIHEFSYIVRATTAGTYRTAPAHAEEMYEPEVFGRTATTTIEVRR